jgi:DKNYY family
MKFPLLIILSLTCLACNHQNKPQQEPADTTLFIPDTFYPKITYKPLRCGLYISDSLDIAYKSVEVFHDSLSDEYIDRYITRVYNGEEEEDGGPVFMKRIVDTSSFTILNPYYFKDKNNIYCFTATSDGGMISTLPGIDLKSFRVNKQNEAFARDKKNIFRHGYILDKKEQAEFSVDTLSW